MNQNHHHPRARLLSAMLLLAVPACDDETTGDNAPTPTGFANSAPRASAGPSHSVEEGQHVEFDGSNSSDPDGDALVFMWEQLSGPPVALLGTEQSKTTLLAPELIGDFDTLYLTFRLTVTDPFGASASDVATLIVHDTNRGPEAAVQGPAEAPARSTISLQAEQCDTTCAPLIDPDGTLTEYRWVQTGSGPAVSFATTDAATAAVTLPDVTRPTQLEITLTTTDDEGKSSSVVHSFIVNPVAAALRFDGIAEDSTLVTGGIWTGFAVTVVNGQDERIAVGDDASLDVVLEQTGGAGTLSGFGTVRADRGTAPFDQVTYDRAELQVTVRASVMGRDLEVSMTVQVLALLPGAIGTAGTSVQIGTMASALDTFAIGGNASTNGRDLPLAFNGTDGMLNSESRGTDGYLAVYDAQGTYAWHASIAGDQGSGFADVVALEFGDGGDLWALSRVQGGASFPSSTPMIRRTGRGAVDVSLTRFDRASGSIIATAMIGGTDNDVPRALTLSTSGDPIIGGDFFGDAADFDPCKGAQELRASAGAEDAFVAMIDATVMSDIANCATSQALLWQWTAGSPGLDTVTAIAYTDTPNGSHGVYVTGLFSGPVDFGDGVEYLPLEGADAAGFLLRLDAQTGSLLWVTVFGGDVGSTKATALTLNSRDEVWVAGSFSGIGNFGNQALPTVLTAVGDEDGFLLHYDRDGVPLHVAALEGVEGARMTVEAISGGSSAGDPMLIVGSHTRTVDLDPGTAEALSVAPGNHTVGFIAAFDSRDTALLWTRANALIDDSPQGSLGHSGVTQTHGASGSPIIYVGAWTRATATDIAPTDALRPHTLRGSQDVSVAALDANGDQI